MAQFIRLTLAGGDLIAVNTEAVAIIRPAMDYEHKGTAVVFTNGQAEIVRETILEIEKKIRGAA